MIHGKAAMSLLKAYGVLCANPGLGMHVRVDGEGKEVGAVRYVRQHEVDAPPRFMPTNPSHRVTSVQTLRKLRDFGLVRLDVQTPLEKGGRVDCYVKADA